MSEGERPTYAYYAAFRATPELRMLGARDAEGVAEEATVLFKEWDERVSVRGHYATLGFRTDTDLLTWWVASSPDDVQDLLAAFNRSPLGRRLSQSHAFLGVHRPPETAPDHVPAFMRGESPRRYLCVYPFDRSYEWYVMPREERATLLREHGEMGREFPEVLPNTTSNFGLGDWEWILAFEADELHRITDCIRRLRDSRARLHTRNETPFITGIRKESLAEVVRTLV
ncbi:MAG: chlorite dismutase family protein [Actinobacteria bacterium]|nr:chlorite dismutase family protein [Actinomycetota bacterium]